MIDKSFKLCRKLEAQLLSELVGVVQVRKWFLDTSAQYRKQRLCKPAKHSRPNCALDC